MRSLSRRFIVVASTVALAACSQGRPPSLTVSQASVESPLVSVDEVALAPMDFSAMRVGELSEEDYVADKDADFRAAWANDKLAMQEQFATHFVRHAGKGGLATSARGAYVLQPRVTYLGRGYWAGAFRKRAVLKAVVDVVGPDGEVVEQIVVREVAGYRRGGKNITAGDRMRSLAKKLGRRTARYVVQRARPAG